MTALEPSGGQVAATAMSFACRRLTLTDFRNHAATELEGDGRPVCLFGPNGAGKTNLLEALTVLGPGRSLRGAAAPDLACVAGIEARARLWSVSAVLEQQGEEVRLGVGLERTPDGGVRRVARCDGRPANAADLARAARMLWVTPAMDRLFTGSPGDRRRFFDRLAMARVAQHGPVAATYERAQRERQRLLSENVFDDAWLSGLEQAMAEAGAAMASVRADTLARLSATIAARPEGAFPKADLALDGPLEQAAAEGVERSALAERLAGLLREGRRRDAAAGRTLSGPHRTDLLVRHAPKDMPAALCSTGEQKALLLGLILAQARTLADDPNAGPALVLIDEAAAHLDADRRGALYEEMLSLPGQSWLTGTDADLFAAFGDRAQRFEVREGRVTQKSTL